MAKKSFSQEELLETSPYLNEKDRVSYKNELAKNGRLQTSTMKRIERIYDSYYYHPKWTLYGKRGKFSFGKKREIPLMPIENRGGKPTEYAEKGAALMISFICNRFIHEGDKNFHATRIKWLSLLGLAGEFAFYRRDYWCNDLGILRLSALSQLSEKQRNSIVVTVHSVYNTNRYEFYREVFSSIENYLSKYHNVKFVEKMYALMSKDELQKNEVIVVSDDEYLYNESIEVDSIKREEIEVEQSKLRAEYSLTKQELLYLRSKKVEEYKLKELKYLKENFCFERIWIEQYIDVEMVIDILDNDLTYTEDEINESREFVKERLASRWTTRLEKKLNKRTPKELFILYYCYIIDELIGLGRFDKVKFFEEHPIMDEGSVLELFELGVFNDDEKVSEELFYLKIMMELKGLS